MAVTWAAAAAAAVQATKALDSYKVHAVVANMLHTRKDRVLLVLQQPGGSSSQVQDLRRPADVKYIESILVPEVVRLHEEYRKASQHS